MKYAELFRAALFIHENLPCKTDFCYQCQHQNACDFAAALLHELSKLAKEELTNDNTKNSNKH